MRTEIFICFLIETTFNIIRQERKFVFGKKVRLGLEPLVQKSPKKVALDGIFEPRR